MLLQQQPLYEVYSMGEREMSSSSTLLQSETEHNTSIEAINPTPASGNTHGLSTPKRKYTEQEKTRIHYAVPKMPH